MDVIYEVLCDILCFEVIVSGQCVLWLYEGLVLAEVGFWIWALFLNYSGGSVTRSVISV